MNRYKLLLVVILIGLASILGACTCDISGGKVYYGCEGDLLPCANSTYDIGSPALWWHHAYITDLYAEYIDGPTGRTATYVIAASNSTTLEQAQADVVCDGINDQVEINAALSVYQKVVCLSGTYYLNQAGTVPDDYCLLIQDDNVEFECLGTLYLNNSQDSHVLLIGDDSNTYSNVIIKINEIDGNHGNQGAGFYYGIYAFITNFLDIDVYCYDTAGSCITLDQCDYAQIDLRSEDCGCHDLYMCDCESCTFDVNSENGDMAIVGIQKGGYHIGRATSTDCNDYGITINDVACVGADLGHNNITVEAYGPASDYGIWVQDSYYNEFHGNINNFNTGVYYDADSGYNIYDGKILNCTVSVTDLGPNNRIAGILQIKDFQMLQQIATVGYTGTTGGTGYDWSSHQSFLIGTGAMNGSWSIKASPTTFWHVNNNANFVTSFFAKFKHTIGGSNDESETWIGWFAAHNVFPTTISNHYGVKIRSVNDGVLPAIYASNGDGAAETSTQLIASMSYDKWYYVWCVYTPNQKIYYFHSTDGIVWTLGATHTTNIPTSVNLVPGCAIKCTEPVDKGFQMIHFNLGY